jgi:hypothetical protein
VTEEYPMPLAKFQPESLTIAVYDETGRLVYEIDLEEADTSAAILDWVFQVALKAWCTPAMIHALLREIDDVCYSMLGTTAQGAYCPFGQSKWVDWKKAKLGHVWKKS